MQELRLSEITVKAGRRPVKPDVVQELAQSIAELGLLNPILVNSDYVLIAGAHRLEAHKLLGLATIKVNVVTMGELQAELAEIDENLSRNDFTALERGKIEKRRKMIYETLYPETKHGAIGNGRSRESTSDISTPESYAKKRAQELGKSESTVQRSIKRAEIADDEVLYEKVSALPDVANNTKELDALVKMKPEQRHAVVDMVSSGDAESVRQAEQELRKQEKRQERQEAREALKNSAPVIGNGGNDGNVQIIHSDCVEYLQSLPSESIDLILIDPPYYGVVDDSWDNQWESMEQYIKWCELWARESHRVLKPTGSFYIWGTVGEKSDSLIRQKLMLDDIGFIFKDWLTWKKKRGLGNKRGWLYTREECLWYVKDNNFYMWNESHQYSEEPNQFKVGMGGHELKSEYKRITNVWTDIPEQLGNKGTLHYTPKPEQALLRIINAHTVEGDVVLDFFAGSGSTGVACKKVNRRCILVDSDIQSYNECSRRVSDA